MGRRVAFIAAVLLAGCPRLQYPECKVDTDCADHGEVCSAGFCKQCRDDADCHPSKPLCKNALCVEKPQCAKREDCPEGQKCSADGKCVAECTPDSAAH